jgi:hypothetical protein
MTPKAVTSNYCKEEIFFASRLKKPIFPLVLEDSFSSMRGGIKTILQRIQWIEMGAPGDFHSKVTVLVDNIKRVRRVRRDGRRASAATGIRRGSTDMDIPVPVPVPVHVDWGNIDRRKILRRLRASVRGQSNDDIPAATSPPLASQAQWTKISDSGKAVPKLNSAEKLDVYICCHESATQVEVIY